LLGVPIRVTLGIPSSRAADARADAELQVGAGRWHGEFSPAVQADWAMSFGSLALCKPYVQAVHWVHASDEEAHQFPNCGLFDASGQPKAVLRQLQALRETHVR